MIPPGRDADECDELPGHKFTRRTICTRLNSMDEAESYVFYHDGQWRIVTLASVYIVVNPDNLVRFVSSLVAQDHSDQPKCE